MTWMEKIKKDDNLYALQIFSCGIVPQECWTVCLLIPFFQLSMMKIFIGLFATD